MDPLSGKARSKKNQLSARRAAGARAEKRGIWRIFPRGRRPAENHRWSWGGKGASSADVENSSKRIQRYQPRWWISGGTSSSPFIHGTVRRLGSARNPLVFKIPGLATRAARRVYNSWLDNRMTGTAFWYRGPGSDSEQKYRPQTRHLAAGRHALDHHPAAWLTILGSDCESDLAETCVGDRLILFAGMSAEPGEMICRGPPH